MFSSEGDIPDKPHPNCKCHVEILDEDTSTSQPDGGQDDGKKDEQRRREDYNDLVDELVGDIKSLLDEVGAFDGDLRSRYANPSLNDAKVVTLAYSYCADLSALKDKLTKLLYTAGSLRGSKAKYVVHVLEDCSLSFQGYRDYYENLVQYFNKEMQRLENKHKYTTNFQTDFDLHSELLNLNVYTYPFSSEDLINDYKLLKKVADSSTGFDAQVFTKDKNIVIVFQGSLPIKDYGVDVFDIFMKHVNPQYDNAVKLLEGIKNDSRYKDYKIILSGYSLGGNTASVLGAINDVDTVVFNPYYGVQSQIQKMADDAGKTIEIHPEKVVVYKSENDCYVRENEQEHIGDKIYELRNEPNSVIKPLNHLLQNTINPDEGHKKTVDIDGRDEKTIFYPKIK